MLTVLWKWQELEQKVRFFYIIICHSKTIARGTGHMDTLFNLLGSSSGVGDSENLHICSRGLHGYAAGGDGDNVCGFTVGMGPRIRGPRGDGVNNTQGHRPRCAFRNLRSLSPSTLWRLDSQ